MEYFMQPVSGSLTSALVWMVCRIFLIFKNSLSTFDWLIYYFTFVIGLFGFLLWLQ